MIFTIRHEPGCSATVEAGRVAGLDIQACPLFEIRPIAWEVPAADVDALLIGSANAIRYGGPVLHEMRDRPVHTVGEATARAAEEAGFTVASTGRGDLQSLVDALAAPLRLLRVTGVEHVPLVAPPGIEVETRVAYESVPLPMPESLAERLRGGALVLLHSAAAARHFAAECDRCEVPRGGIALAALAPRIADAAGEGWRDARSATVPSEAALLALARDMCHYPESGR